METSIVTREFYFEPANIIKKAYFSVKSKQKGAHIIITDEKVQYMMQSGMHLGGINSKIDLIYCSKVKGYYYDHKNNHQVVWFECDNFWYFRNADGNYEEIPINVSPKELNIKVTGAGFFIIGDKYKLYITEDFRSCFTMPYKLISEEFNKEMRIIRISEPVEGEEDIYKITFLTNGKTKSVKIRIWKNGDQMMAKVV